MTQEDPDTTEARMSAPASDGGRRQQKGRERRMEAPDDECAVLLVCPLTKTLISVCVIPQRLYRLLVLINDIHLPLTPSLPSAPPPSPPS